MGEDEQEKKLRRYIVGYTVLMIIFVLWLSHM